MSVLVSRLTNERMSAAEAPPFVVQETKSCPFCANLGWKARPRSPPSPAIFTGMPATTARSATTVGVLGGLAVGNDTMRPSSSAANHRELSPGGWAIATTSDKATLANTGWSVMAVVIGGRAGALQVLFAARVSSPKSACTIPESVAASAGGGDVASSLASNVGRTIGESAT